MPCDKVELPGGGFAIVCSRGQRKAKPCESCGRPGTIQCDYPVTRNGKTATCDRWQCRQCATSVGPNVDYCKPHAAMGPPKL